MNTIVFLCGAGCGSLIATLAMLFVMFRAVNNARSKETEKVHAYNEASLRALEERNEIGRAELKALEAIADAARH